MQANNIESLEEAVPLMALVNGTRVLVSKQMAASEFFAAHQRYNPNAIAIIDQYSNEFLILNMSVHDRYMRLRNMRLDPFIEVFRAISFFGCVDELIVSVKRSLTFLFNSYTMEQMLYLTDFLYEPEEHPEYIHVSGVHCDMMRLRIRNMTTVAELNSVAEYVVEISDEDLRADWEAVAIRVSTQIVIAEIETEIITFISRYPGIEYASVDWTNLQACGLSQGFIERHAEYARTRSELQAGGEYDIVFRHMRSLSLYGLPIDTRAIIHSQTIGLPEFWQRRPVRVASRQYYTPDHALVDRNPQWDENGRLNHRLIL